MERLEIPLAPHLAQDSGKVQLILSLFPAFGVGKLAYRSYPRTVADNVSCPPRAFACRRALIEVLEYFRVSAFDLVLALPFLTWTCSHYDRVRTICENLHDSIEIMFVQSI